jgi:hypothetical protein
MEEVPNNNAVVVVYRPGPDAVKGPGGCGRRIHTAALVLLYYALFVWCDMEERYG